MAVSYMIKPLKMRDVKSLFKWLKKPEEEKDEEEGLKGLKKYKSVKKLGKGAAGEV